MNSIHTRLSVRYPDYELQVNLDLPGQGITALFGTSGAGKSTFLRAVAGLEHPRDSLIQICGETWQDDANGIYIPTYKRPLGFVFQDAALFPHLTVLGNMEYGMKRVPSEQRSISLERIIDLLGIVHLTNRMPDSLSGGERQRVGIARALATSPRLILMDEPLASLDTQRKSEIMPYLTRLNEELKIPILYVSHALDEIAYLADHLVLLENGRVLAADSTERLLTRLDMPLAYGNTASAILHSRITDKDPEFQLATAEFKGGTFYIPGSQVEVGQSLRLRVQARDVSLALERPSQTSILNIIKTTISGISNDAPGYVMVELDACGSRLLCRITSKSANTLSLHPGKILYAQIKSVAIVD